ncbi:MAG: MBL fold metallo-hydrolase [Cytophagales bacterium]
MKVIFLGTGTSQGVPVIACDCAVCNSLDYRDKRLRTSVYVECDDVSIVIDPGPDFRQQMLVNRIKKVDAILFTHEHKDHTAGLDDIRAFNHKYNYDMPIFGSAKVIEQLKNEFKYIFSEDTYPGIPRIEPHIIENEAFQFRGLTIIPILVYHYKLPVFGFRINDFTYITDAKTIDEKELNKTKGSRFSVLNALQKAAHISHLTLEEAINIAQNWDVERTYFTHLSHVMGTHAETEKLLPQNIFIAYDGLTLEW